MKYFNCIVPIKTNRQFIYEADSELAADIRPGSIVKLEFRNAETLGVAVSEAGPAERMGIKGINSISSIEMSRPVCSEFMKLMEWISDYYFTDIGIVWRNGLPSLTGNVKRYIYSYGEGDVFEMLKELTGDIPLAKGTLEKALKKSDRNADEMIRKGNVIEHIFPYKEPLGTGTILNDEQKTAFDIIRQDIDSGEFRASLLYGPPASGKSEVYIHLLEHMLKRTDRNALMLFPEIGLAQIMYEKITDRFGTGEAVIAHSELSQGERTFAYRAAAEGRARIIVGTRSAVFVPSVNIGLVVIDEEQDISFKQTESMPHYNGRDAAVYYAKLHNAAAVLVSATPSAESVHNVHTGKYRRINLSRPYKGGSPRIDIYEKSGRNEFPAYFMDAISDSLSADEQSVIFLNRRGFLNLYKCSSCGEYFKCNDCSVSYSFHKSENKFICHYCGSVKPHDARCTKCNGILKSTGVWGTEKVEQIIHRLYPDAQIDRLDTDTVMRKGSRKAVIDRMLSRETDILIGTQMVSKGYDMPDVVLAIMLNADSMINMPDFRSEERFMQLLIQTAGRAGRREKQGRIIIEAEGLREDMREYIKNLDYEGFMHSELKRREEAKFPPYSRMLRITVKNKDKAKGVENINRLYEKCMKTKGVTVFPPVPAPVYKLGGNYRYNIYVLYRQFSRVRNMIDMLKMDKIQFNVDNG